MGGVNALRDGRRAAHVQSNAIAASRPSSTVRRRGDGRSSQGPSAASTMATVVSCAHSRSAAAARRGLRDRIGIAQQPCGRNPAPFASSDQREGSPRSRRAGEVPRCLRSNPGDRFRLRASSRAINAAARSIRTTSRPGAFRGSDIPRAIDGPAPQPQRHCRPSARRYERPRDDVVVADALLDARFFPIRLDGQRWQAMEHPMSLRFKSRVWTSARVIA